MIRVLPLGVTGTVSHFVSPNSRYLQVFHGLIKHLKLSLLPVGDRQDSPYDVILLEIGSASVARDPGECDCEHGATSSYIEGGVRLGAFHDDLGRRDERRDFVTRHALVLAVVGLLKVFYCQTPVNDANSVPSQRPPIPALPRDQRTCSPVGSHRATGDLDRGAELALVKRVRRDLKLWWFLDKDSQRTQ